MNFASKFQSAKHSTGNHAAYILKQTKLVYALQSQHMGRLTWYIIDVLPSQHKAFQHVLSSGNPVNFPDFGSILFSGYGETPPQSLQDELREKYGLFTESS